MEEVARAWHGEQEADLAAAPALAEDRHIAGIAAERGDVVGYPFQGLDDIQHAGDAGLGVLGPEDLTQMQVAEDVQAV